MPNQYTTQPSWSRPCCVCRLKKRKCDRQRPVCGRCREFGLSEECSYRPEDMPPPVSTKSLFIKELKELKRQSSLPPPSLPAPMVVIGSAAPPSSTWNGREPSPRRMLHRSREAASRRRYTLGVFPHRRTQSGSAVYPARGNLSQAPEQIDSDESSVGQSEETSDAIEVSSGRSDETFHTATRSPVPELIRESRRAQGSHFTRLRQAQERRTGSVKREEPIEDRLPRLRHSHLANGTLVSAVVEVDEVDDVDEEMMDSPVDFSKEDADRLVTVYLNLDYVSLPILDLQDFRATYEAASVAGDSTTSNAFYATLNTIFALACLSVANMGDEGAKYFFKEGQRLANLFDQYKSIDLLRLYLLQVQYLNAIGDLHTAWSLIGSTIRLAQSLRLPFDAKQHGHSRKGRETCRRLWHGAIIMERILALRLGIAPQTPDPLRVPLPTHLDTDYVDVISGAQSSAQGERASIIEFFTACARLYRLVDDVMAWEDEARVRPQGCAMKKLLSLDFTPFLKADSLLHDWNQSLPSSLRSSGSHGTDAESIVVRQRNILRARYLYLRLRLNRPLVTLGLALTAGCKCKSDGQPHIVERRLTPDSPIALSLVHGASIKCVRAALELTELIRVHEAGLLRFDTYDASHCLNPPYWESVEYLYVCGTVFLASFNHQCPFFGDMTDEEDEQCRVLWPCIVNLLDRYQGYRRRGRTNNVAQACSRTLSELAKAVDGTSGTGWTVDSAVLGQDARARFSQRTEMESPIRHRRISSAIQTDPLGNVAEFPVWMDSLPVDLVG